MNVEEKDLPQPETPEVSQAPEVPPEERTISETEEGAGEAREPESVEQLKTLLDQREQEYKNLYDKYLRALAEMENLRKRMARDQADAVRYANEKIFQETIPVLDNLERALYHTREARDFDALLQGLELVLREFNSVLERFGVRAIESVGKPFDPMIHHAVEQEETSEHEHGTVVRELRKGYLYHERTLRPALVVVAKRASSGEAPEMGAEGRESPQGEGQRSSEKQATEQ